MVASVIGASWTLVAERCGRGLAVAIAFLLFGVLFNANAQSTPVLFTNLLGRQAANIDGPEALSDLHDLLRQLGAMPKTSAPTIVHVRSIDSRFAERVGASEAVTFKEQTNLIVETLARLGAPESVVVATQWGTAENRVADGQMLGIDTPIFPTTTDQLEASDLGWLVEPQGFELVWDDEGALAQLAASRLQYRGMEFLLPVRMILCANDQSVLGWARPQRAWRPTDAGLGRFVESCASGSLQDFDANYLLPAELLSDYGLTGAWFALLLLDTHAQPVPVATVPEAARAILELATPAIPLMVVAGETLADAYETVVPAVRQWEVLAGAGVEVDEELSAALPGWVYDFATHPASTLVIFDDTGRAVAHFVATSANPTGEETLQQWMIVNGFF